MEDKLWKIFQPNDPGDQPREADGSLRAGLSRRSFLEMIGFSATAMALNGCRAPEQKVIPFATPPVELTPGVANWYASTCAGCGSGCGVLVKVRDGRPIKLEGNPEHPLSQGGLCAMAHGLIFGLYDSRRVRHPLIRFEDSTWEELDRQILEKLAAIKQSHGKVRVLTPTLVSPTSRRVIARFVEQFADGKQVVYQPVSHSAIRQAHLRSHKRAVLPSYHFDRARRVVSFDADFLGTWISPVQFTRAYSNARNLRDGRRTMLRHVQFESRMSLTGSNADRRIRISPAEQRAALLWLAKEVARQTDVRSHLPAELESFSPTSLSPPVRQAVEDDANQLLKWQGESLVVCGSNDADTQFLVNFINHAVGSYGKTLDLVQESFQDQSDDVAMQELVREMNSDQVAALIISGVNPAYDYFNAEAFTLGFSKVPLKISLNPTMDETSSYADYVCPQHHFLEAWDDAEPVRGVFSLCQPTIAPFFKTRAFQESLLRWSGDARSFYEVLRASWSEKQFKQQKQFGAFDEFWDHSLREGVYVLGTPSSTAPAFSGADLKSSVQRLKTHSFADRDHLSIVLYEKVALRDGAYGNNPWLHELPDPISKITWDNYACVSPKLADQLELEEGRRVRLSKGSGSIELPIHVQPGQHDACVAIALGYGRTKAGPAGDLVGANAFPLVRFYEGTFQYEDTGFRLEKLPTKAGFASTQLHQSVEGRPIVQELTLAQYLEGHNHPPEEQAPKSLWKDFQYPEHKWAMVIDLNACVGCSACLLSCQAENNVPVVGKTEVYRQREMHWIRIDRYAEGSDDQLKVAFQPVMCNQCDNASCESVCPVLATVHSSEGLNMQVYNRCVGTRYCENNCPYKVRRFNWFNHPHDDPVANLALNPDVTVRTRGVMEKCTFCVQRIEEAKIRARNEGRPIQDGEIQPACQQSCPAGAIFFGDLVDAKSRVAHLKRDRRNYVLLEELNLRPQISYLAKVRNTQEVKA